MCNEYLFFFENVRLVLFTSIFLREVLSDNVKNFLFVHCILNDFVILLLAGFIVLYVARAAKRAGACTEFS